MVSSVATIESCARYMVTPIDEMTTGWSRANPDATNASESDCVSKSTSANTTLRGSPMPSSYSRRRFHACEKG
jgi:hypothetical protein